MINKKLCNLYMENTIRKMISVRVIHKAMPVKEENVLRKVVKKYYAVKGMILVQRFAMRNDLEEFINVSLQIQDKVSLNFFPDTLHFIVEPDLLFNTSRI